MTYIARLLTWLICSTLFIFQLTGCSGGGSRGNPGPETVSIKGVAQAGPIDGKVTIYELDANGNKVMPPLGTQEDVKDGVFNISVPKGDHPIIIAASGTYKDEATGAIVDMKGQELTQIVADTQQSSDVPVTPTTTFVADMVQEKIRKGELLRMDAKGAIEESSQKVAQLFGVDPDTIKAVPKPPTQMDSLSNEGKAALLLTVISQAMKDGKLTPDKGVNPIEAIKSFSSALAQKSEENKKISGDDFQTDPKLENFGNQWSTKLKEARDSVIRSVNLELPSGWSTPKADLGNINYPPVARGDFLKVIDTIPVGKLTASDPNGDVLFFFIVNQPKSGEIEFTNENQGTFIYRAWSTTFGNDYFTFSVTDGSYVSEPVRIDLLRVPNNGVYLSKCYRSGLEISDLISGTGYCDGDQVFYIEGFGYPGLDRLGTGISGERYFSNGTLGTGLYNGKWYINGFLGTGLSDGKFYSNGSLGTGIFDEIFYENGLPGTGLFSGKYYVSGFLGSELFNNEYYQNGSLGTGLFQGFFYKDGKLGTGSFNGIYYANGKPGTGLFENIFFKDGIRGNGFFEDKYYLNGELLTGFSPSQTYYDTMGTRNFFYRDGVLGTGIYLEKCYSLGRLVTGLCENKFYKFGELGTGLFGGLFYKDGILGTALFQGKKYVNGHLQDTYPNPLRVTPDKVSFLGGDEISLEGNRFDTAASVKICGLTSKVVAAAENILKVEVPAYGQGEARCTIEISNPDGQIGILDSTLSLVTQREVNQTGAPLNRSVGFSGIWTGTHMIIWGGCSGGSSGEWTCHNTGSSFNPKNNTWTSINQEGAPSARGGHSAVWTGTEMLVWGGTDYINTMADGALYNPATDTWRTIQPSTIPRTGHRAFWTGTEMIVLYGTVPSKFVYERVECGPNCSAVVYRYPERELGQRFNLSTGTWTDLPTANAPRGGLDAVWAERQIVAWENTWDGLQGTIFDPQLNTWTKLPRPSPAIPRTKDFSIVWTGKEIVLFGGLIDSEQGGAFSRATAQVRRYDMTKNTWSSEEFVGIDGNDPRGQGIHGHKALWIGKEMVVLGSEFFGGKVFYYNPSATYLGLQRYYNQAIPAKSGFVALWTGREVIVWGGPVKNSWGETVSENAGAIIYPKN